MAPENAAEAGAPGSVAIPLDEHGWIFGRRGIHADVLLVTPQGAGIALRVLESKYLQDANAQMARKARRQVEETSAALREWLQLPEIEPYVRRGLHDAILAHLDDDDPRKSLARKVGEGVPVTVDATPEAHIWLWSTNTKPQDGVVENVRTVIHTADDTKARLLSLCGAA